MWFRVWSIYSNTIDNFLPSSACGGISNYSNNRVADMILPAPREPSQDSVPWNVWPVPIQITTFHQTGSTRPIVGGGSASIQMSQSHMTYNFQIIQDGYICSIWRSTQTSVSRIRHAALRMTLHWVMAGAIGSQTSLIRGTSRNMDTRRRCICISVSL